jgi:hypothetical protein
MQRRWKLSSAQRADMWNVGRQDSRYVRLLERLGPRTGDFGQICAPYEIEVSELLCAQAPSLDTKPKQQ